jgi:hypothetical protein
MESIDVHALAQQLSSLAGAYRERADTLEQASQALTVVAETKEFFQERDAALRSAKTLLGQSPAIEEMLKGVVPKSSQPQGFARPRSSRVLPQQQDE